MKKLFWTVLVIMMAASMSVNLTSCGDDDEAASGTGNVGNTTEKIKNRDLMGYWEFNGNIAASFWLRSDGTCKVESLEHKWAYDTETKTLAITGGYTYIIKLLTSDMLSAEWSSVKYGTRTDTWTATAPYALDPQWEKLIVGTWKTENGSTIIFKDGKFDAKLTFSDKPTFEFSGTYGLRNDGNMLELVSNETFDGKKKYYYSSSEYEVKQAKLSLYIRGISGNRIRFQGSDLVQIDVDGASYSFGDYEAIYTFVND